MKQIFLICICMSVINAIAESPHSPEGPPELAPLQWLVGDWNCTKETIIPKPIAKGNEESRVKYFWDIQDHWLVSDYWANFEGKEYLTRCFYGAATKARSYQLICLGSGSNDIASVFLAPFSDGSSPQFSGPSKYQGNDFKFQKIYKKISDNEYIVQQVSEPMGKAGNPYQAKIHCKKN